MPEKALLIFIKNPRKGKVKTRLAATVGDEKALEVYHTLLDYTRQTVLQVPVERQLWYSQYITEHDGWDKEQFTKKIQQGDSLGRRMKYAFKQAFSEGFEKIVIIGSDCAQLEPAHIKEAYIKLETQDIVIGPSRDGGYYLLGMNQFVPQLFEDKSWSTPRVFQQTLDACQSSGLRYHILDELNDVDTEADWQQVSDRF